MKNLLKKLLLRLLQLSLIIVGRTCQKIAEICSQALQLTMRQETSFDKKNATIPEIESFYNISRRQAYAIYKKQHPEKYSKGMKDFKIINSNDKIPSPANEIVKNIFQKRKLSER